MSVVVGWVGENFMYVACFGMWREEGSMDDDDDDDGHGEVCSRGWR